MANRFHQVLPSSIKNNRKEDLAYDHNKSKQKMISTFNFWNCFIIIFSPVSRKLWKPCTSLPLRPFSYIQRWLRSATTLSWLTIQPVLGAQKQTRVLHATRARGPGVYAAPRCTSSTNQWSSLDQFNHSESVSVF